MYRCWFIMKHTSNSYNVVMFNKNNKSQICGRHFRLEITKAKYTPSTCNSKTSRTPRVIGAVLCMFCVSLFQKKNFFFLTGRLMVYSPVVGTQVQFLISPWWVSAKHCHLQLRPFSTVMYWVSMFLKKIENWTTSNEDSCDVDKILTN